MKRTLLTIILALALSLGVLPLTAGAEWQQIPTVPADCSVVMSEGLELTEVRAFCQWDENWDPKDFGEGEMIGMWFEFTASGPAQIRDVCCAATLETKPSPAEAAKAASEGIRWRAGQECPAQPLPIRDSELGLFSPRNYGQTMYRVLAGLDENSALAGWAVVEFTVGESEDVGRVEWGGRWIGDTSIYWTCSADREGTRAELFLQGNISEEAPALAAVYNQAGRMLSVRLLTREGSVSIASGTTARVFWLYGDTWTPRIEQMTVPLNAIIE